MSRLTLLSPEQRYEKYTHEAMMNTTFQMVHKMRERLREDSILLSGSSNSNQQQGSPVAKQRPFSEVLGMGGANVILCHAWREINVCFEKILVYGWYTGKWIPSFAGRKFIVSHSMNGFAAASKMLTPCPSISGVSLSLIPSRCDLIPPSLFSTPFVTR